VLYLQGHGVQSEAVLQLLGDRLWVEVLYLSRYRHGQVWVLPQMKHLIEIDRTTLRRNPNAGRTEYAVPDRTTTYETRLRLNVVDQDRDELLLEHVVDSHVMEVTVIDRRKDLLKVILPYALQEGCIERLLARDVLSITLEHRIDRPVQRFKTVHPGPSWLYDYVPTEVTCDHCGAVFLHTELTTESNMPDDIQYDHSESVCPKCGHWDCCEVEFEKLTDELIKEAHNEISIT
jgi:hypothetical protein